MKICNLRRTRMIGMDKKGRPREHYKFSLFLEGFYINGFIYVRESKRILVPLYKRNGLRLRAVRAFGSQWLRLIEECETAVKCLLGEIENPGAYDDKCAVCKHYRYRHNLTNGHCHGTLSRACSKACPKFYEPISLPEIKRLAGGEIDESRQAYERMHREEEIAYARMENMLAPRNQTPTKSLPIESYIQTFEDGVRDAVAFEGRCLSDRVLTHKKYLDETNVAS